MKRTMIFLLLGVLLVGCSPAAPIATPTNTSVPSVTYVYAFGDDSADIGNGLQAIKKGIETGEVSQDALDTFSSIFW